MLFSIQVIVSVPYKVYPDSQVKYNTDPIGYSSVDNFEILSMTKCMGMSPIVQYESVYEYKDCL